MALKFVPTETQQAIAATIQGVLADEYDFAARRAAVAAGGPVPYFWAMLADLGLLGIEVGEDAGGIGGSFAETAVVLEALGGALVLEPFVPTAVLGVGLLNALGSPEQRAAVLGSVVAGSSKLALAHDEGIGARNITRAVRAGGDWRLSGAKRNVLGGDSATLFLVSAAIDDGVSLFLLPVDTIGMTRHGYRLYDDHGAADLTIDAVVADTSMLGASGAAQAAIDLALDRGAAAAIHEAIGAMERLCAMTPDYLKARVQFGQPLARFQVLQHRMVEMGIALELARSMALLATAALDDPDPVARARDVSAAKLHVGEAARLVGQAAMQLHGGIALTDDYPAGHYFKRLTMLARQFGDELHHLDRYMATAA